MAGVLAAHRLVVAARGKSDPDDRDGDALQAEDDVEVVQHEIECAECLGAVLGACLCADGL